MREAPPPVGQNSLSFRTEGGDRCAVSRLRTGHRASRWVRAAQVVGVHSRSSGTAVTIENPEAFPGEVVKLLADAGWW